MVGEVELDGVGGALGAVGEAEAPAVGEGDVGRARVGAVEGDDLAGGEELHVHSRDAEVALQELPLAAAAAGAVAIRQ